MQKLAIGFVPMLLGIICHEVAHGYAAWRLGDPTAKYMGRLTLNPIPHIDPAGTLMFVITALAAPFMLGWAKPVPIDPRYFKNPRKGMMLTSFAGPLTNFVLAFAFALALRGLLSFVPESMQHTATFEYFINMTLTGVWINIALAWFNLMPLPPLDGSHILSGILPLHLAVQYERIGRYGILIVLLLMATGLLGDILWPLLQWSVMSVLFVVGLA